MERAACYAPCAAATPRTRFIMRLFLPALVLCLPLAAADLPAPPKVPVAATTAAAAGTFDAQKEALGLKDVVAKVKAQMVSALASNDPAALKAAIAAGDGLNTEVNAYNDKAVAAGIDDETIGKALERVEAPEVRKLSRELKLKLMDLAAAAPAAVPAPAPLPAATPAATK